MRATLEGIQERFDHAVLTYVDDDGYPLSVAAPFAADRKAGTITLSGVRAPADREANVIVSHIRPAPGIGYDERRYRVFWGTPRAAGDGVSIEPVHSFAWDESDVPFVEYSEMGVPRAHRYLAALSARVGRTVRPKLSRGWLFLRTTRLPFVSATAVAVFLGVAVAAAHGTFRLGHAVATLFGALFIHLGLNIANDVFDTMSGADMANTTPTQFSGGSRVVQYGLVKMRSLVALGGLFYAAGIGIGIFLVASTGSATLLWLGLAGVAISLAYTAPPLRLVHRGLGEVAVAAGFGPIVVLGSYVVQTGRLSWEALYASLPVAILIALVLYVNEVPDRRGDSAVGKRTLPVRFSKETVIRLYVTAVWASYALIVGGALSGLLPFLTLIALATVPLGMRVTRALRAHYDDPYALMPSMGINVLLHNATTALLVLGYVAAIVAGEVTDAPPALLR